MWRVRWFNDVGFCLFVGHCMLEAGIASVFWVRQPRMANGAWDGAAALLRCCILLLSSFGFKHDLASVCLKRRFGSGVFSKHVKSPSNLGPCNDPRSDYEIDMYLMAYAHYNTLKTYPKASIKALAKVSVPSKRQLWVCRTVLMILFLLSLSQHDHTVVPMDLLLFHSTRRLPIHSTICQL